MPQTDRRTSLEADICVHIFTVSAGMVGVCLTVIGILQIVIPSHLALGFADDFLAGDAALFLLACILSYWALRTRSKRRMHRVERFADGVFLLALIFMGSICVFITYAMSIR